MGGEQLCWGAEPEIFRSFHLLHWPYLLSQSISWRTSLHYLHPRRLEELHNIQSPCHSGLYSLSSVRGSPVCLVHLHYVWDASFSYLVWWDRNRVSEKGRGTLGEEVEVEEHSGGLWQILLILVLSIQRAAEAHQAARLPFLGLTIWRHRVWRYQWEYSSCDLSPVTCHLCQTAGFSLLCVIFSTVNNIWVHCVAHLKSFMCIVHNAIWYLSILFWFRIISNLSSDFESLMCYQCKYSKKSSKNTL